VLELVRIYIHIAIHTARAATAAAWRLFEHSVQVAAAAAGGGAAGAAASSAARDER
jgi:hypothetical protein